MLAPIAQVLALTLVPVAATAGGATIAALRPAGPRVQSAIQHFAAGVVFSVVAVELLPDVTRAGDLLEIGWTFAAGLGFMLVIEAFGRRLDRRGRGLGQVIAIAVDVFVDGVLIGIAFAAGTAQGLLLTMALAGELLAMGVAMATTLAAGGAGRARTIMLPTAVSGFLVVGALAGDTILRGATPHALAGLLSFGSAALLYLVTEELLVEAHEVEDTTVATSLFFAGFLLFLLLGMLETSAG